MKEKYIPIQVRKYSYKIADLFANYLDFNNTQINKNSNSQIIPLIRELTLVFMTTKSRASIYVNEEKTISDPDLFMEAICLCAQHSL